MPRDLTEADIFTAFSDLENDVVQEPFIKRKAMDVATPIEEYSFFADRVQDNADAVVGIRAKIPFKTKNNNSLRPITRTGYFPDGNPLAVDSMTFTLKGMAGTAMVTHEDVLATNGDHVLLAELMTDALQDIYDNYPRYRRQSIWSPTSGVLCQAASFASGTLTVTCDNAGLYNSHVYDRVKWIWRNMYLAVYSSAGAFKGIVQVVSKDETAGTFVVDADTTPTGIADNDVFVVSDIAGAETGYNNSGPSIFDILDDDNTFQGVDRSVAANAWAQAQVYGNSGTGRLPTYSVLSTFFHNLYKPKYGFTDYRVIDYYWSTYLRDNVRFVQGNKSRQYIDGYTAVEVDKTMLVEDADAPNDKILVADFMNTFYYTKGTLENPRGEGWVRVAKRPYYEYNLIQYALLGFEGDARRVGRLDDIDITAES